MRRRGVTVSLGVGAALAGVMLLVALVSLAWTPCDPAAMELSARFAPPSREHLFGCDQFGRDVLSRCMVAARPALLVGTGSVVLGALVGAALGSVAGLGSQAVRSTCMRLADALMAFPGVLLAMVLVLAMGRGLTSVLVAVAVFMVPVFARLTCQTTLEVRGSLFVKAARAAGMGPVRTMVRHVLPNIAPQLLTQLSARIGTAMLLEASLSFLGLGVQPPTTSWGYMLSEALPYVTSHPGLAVAPGVLLMLATLGFNLMGDGLNDLALKRGRP